MPQAPQTELDYAGSWQAWHTQREAELAAPYGWLSLTGIFWLEPAAPLRVPGFPGLWRTCGDAVSYEPEPGRPVRLADGDLVAGATPVEPYESGRPTKLYADQLQAELVYRGGRFAVRLRDPDSPDRAAFSGVPHYPPSLDWVVPARFEAYPAARPVTVGAVLPGVQHHKTALGRFWFTLGGQELSLEVFQTTGAGPSILFKDLTNGVTTYGAGRFIYFGHNDFASISALDFNRAITPPCHFSQFCTCPLPPPTNYLPVAIAAGETTISL